MNRMQKGAVIVLTVAIALTTISLALLWAPPTGHGVALSSERNLAGASSLSLFAPRTLATVIHGGSTIAQVGHATSTGVSHSIYPTSPTSPGGGTSPGGTSGFHVMKHCSMAPHLNRLKA